MVKRREAALGKLLVEVCHPKSALPVVLEPIFVVGRRWNSWYPSVFPVPGGAYAIVGPAEGDEGSQTLSVKRPSAIIDPGFQAMRTLAGLGVSTGDLTCCAVTHNHPDHMGGIFELMAARHALGKQTRLLCSASCSAMFGDCSGFSLQVKTLDGTLSDLIHAYNAGDHFVRIRVKGFDTPHEEISRANSSQGLCIMTGVGSDRNNLEETSELILLGDTEYDRAEHRDRMIGMLCRASVRVVVLHIGSAQLKNGTGKHLYLRGLRTILTDMEGQLSTIRYEGKQLVLVSEWGLEHATRQQIIKVFGRSLPGFNGFSPIIETVRSLQKGLTKIQLIPADIGLKVGMQSGRIFLDDGPPAAPQEVEVQCTEDGLRYVRRLAASAP